jgi:hypothetical protein
MEEIAEHNAEATERRARNLTELVRTPGLIQRAMLRLAIFAAWDVQYELGLRILIQRDKCDFGGTLLSEDQRGLADNALKQRYRAMRAWNPMSVTHVLDFDPLEYDDPMYSELDRQRARRWREGWNMWMRWAVPYCSRGILQLSSQEYVAHLRRHRNAWKRQLVD